VKHAAKRGRGAEGKTLVLDVVKTQEKGAGFVVMEAVKIIGRIIVVINHNDQQRTIPFQLKIQGNV